MVFPLLRKILNPPWQISRSRNCCKIREASSLKNVTLSTNCWKETWYHLTTLPHTDLLIFRHTLQYITVWDGKIAYIFEKWNRLKMRPGAMCFSVTSWRMKAVPSEILEYMKISSACSFIFMQINLSHFHKNGFALRLALKQKDSRSTRELGNGLLNWRDLR